MCVEMRLFIAFFKLSLNKNKKVDYESDYEDVMNFLRRMEFYRFVPTPYNVKRLAMPITIAFLKRTGLYNTVKKAYFKLFP